MYKYITVLLAANLLFLADIKANSVIDSIGVENLNGSKVIIHQIVKNDTYYSIGRRYNVSPKEIMTFNENKYLQVGVLIKVPTRIPFNSAYGSTSGSSTESIATSNGNKPTFIDYEVKPKDNLNSIARVYGTTANELKRINELRTINLRIGQILRVPANNADAGSASINSASNNTAVNSSVGSLVPVVANTPTRPTEQPKPILPAGSTVAARPIAKPVDTATKKPDVEEKFIEHTVASNETMYSIATTYKLTIDQLKAKNNLQNNSLRVGQKLLISGQYPVRNQAVGDGLEENETIKDPSLRGDASRYGLNQVDEKGTAVWITDLDLDPVKMLVLHRTAPVGTIVKVTNPMTNRSAFAKVVGKYTENESTRDVIIVMTKAVADSIGAIDKRFFCNITYSGQDNEQ